MLEPAMRVLFVEDNAVNRRVVREMLAAADIDLDEAEDGQAGLEAIETGDYDLILMDLRMPRMDGLTAIRAIRGRADDKAKAPVIVVTADAGATIRADCLAAGADDLLLKPVSMEALFDAIGRLLAARGGDAALVA
jgi:CheY-like chemotaxis protein